MLVEIELTLTSGGLKVPGLTVVLLLSRELRLDCVF